MLRVGPRLRAARARIDREGWLDLASVAGFGFLVLLGAGAVLVLAAKLQYADLGAGSDPVAVLSALVITALGVLRVPVHVGDVVLSVLPLGALAAFIYGVAWATARLVRRRAIEGLRPAAREGAKVAIPFALICWLAALVFRIRAEPTPVAADGLGALLRGAMWGLVGGALGGAVATRHPRELVRALLGTLRARWRWAHRGLTAAATMLFATFLLATPAALLWIIVGLLRGGSTENFNLAIAAAAAIYLVAFGPNILIAIVTISLGAAVNVGAQVGSAGRMIGGIADVSLSEWGDGGTPWLAFLLLAIPIVSCSLGGSAAARKAGDDRAVVPTLAVASATYALVLFVLAALAEARLGAGLVRQRGFGLIAPEAWMVLVLAFAWAAAGGFIGWTITTVRRGAAASQPRDTAAPMREP